MMHAVPRGAIKLCSLVACGCSLDRRAAATLRKGEGTLPSVAHECELMKSMNPQVLPVGRSLLYWITLRQQLPPYEPCGV